MATVSFEVTPHGSSSEDFITGFLLNGVVNGRPCDIFRFGSKGFLSQTIKQGLCITFTRNNVDNRVAKFQTRIFKLNKSGRCVYPASKAHST
jgi:hypothetical protein